MSKGKKTDFTLPLRLDTQACMVMNEGIVLDAKRRVVTSFDTIEEAEEFIAEANGVDVETMRRETEESAQMHHEYLRNLKQGKKVS